MSKGDSIKIGKDIAKYEREVMKQRELDEDNRLGLYFTTRALNGYHNINFYWLIGSRGRGKSFAVVEDFLQSVKKYGQENVKCYYFRVSDLSVKAMLANKGAKCIDALLVRKYNLNLTTHADVLYNDEKPLIYFYPLVSAAKRGKGLAEYDPDFLGNRPVDPKTGKKVKRMIYLIIDEFMTDQKEEKKSIGNPANQFKMYFENILRDQEQLDYKAVKIFGCANAVSECSDFLAQLAGFIPEKQGIFKLTRKHMLVVNIPNSKAYMDKRKKSIGADIMDYEDDENYTNEVKRDLETLKPKNKPLKNLTAVICFSKNKRDWYSLWDGNILVKYKNQPFRPSQKIPMFRYLDSRFNDDLVKSIIERTDQRCWLYNDLITQSTFIAWMKQVKKK